MLKTLAFLALSMLTALSLSLNASQTVSGQFQPLQPEDMTYYQNYHWSKPFSRRDSRKAKLSGQEHMHNKMLSCFAHTTYHLPDHLKAFKQGHHEPTEFMQEGNPYDAQVEGEWLVYNFAKEHFQDYSGSLDYDADDDPDLRRIRDKFWMYCLNTLDVWLFTQAAQRRANGDANWREFLREGEPLNKQY